ncbi:MAG TPA: pentapeptide repeat-containing protein [Methanothrix sp.]|nr:pentapeptide repeat-containing protein [Methanothrix sp.]
MGAPNQFLGAKFSGGALFREAHFESDVNFMDAQFSRADFRGAQFCGRINLIISKFDEFHIRWHELKSSLFYDGPTYLSLVKNFKKLELWDDAESCYYHYRRKAQANKSWRDWSKLLDIVAWISCEYGVKVWPIAIWILIFLVFFASLYGSFNGITTVGPSEIFLSINIAPIVVQNAPPINAYSGGLSSADYLYFSAAALTGSAPTELHPIGTWKYIVVIERLIGYLLLALFVVVLTKKLIR